MIRVQIRYFLRNRKNMDRTQYSQIDDIVLAFSYAVSKIIPVSRNGIFISNHPKNNISPRASSLRQRHEEILNYDIIVTFVGLKNESEHSISISRHVSFARCQVNWTAYPKLLYGKYPNTIEISLNSIGNWLTVVGLI